MHLMVSELLGFQVGKKIFSCLISRAIFFIRSMFDLFDLDFLTYIFDLHIWPRSLTYIFLTYLKYIFNLQLSIHLTYFSIFDLWWPLRFNWRFFPVQPVNFAGSSGWKAPVFPGSTWNFRRGSNWNAPFSDYRVPGQPEKRVPNSGHNFNFWCKRGDSYRTLLLFFENAKIPLRTKVSNSLVPETIFVDFCLCLLFWFWKLFKIWIFYLWHRQN